MHCTLWAGITNTGSARTAAKAFGAEVRENLLAGASICSITYIALHCSCQGTLVTCHALRRCSLPWVAQRRRPEYAAEEAQQRAERSSSKKASEAGCHGGANSQGDRPGRCRHRQKVASLEPQEEPAFPVGARVDVLLSDDSVLLTGTIAGKEQGSLAACS